LYHQNTKAISMKNFLLSLISVLYIIPATAQDATSILAEMDKILFSPKDKSGMVSIILIEKDGKEKVREAAMYQKGADKKLFRYTKPESQAGIATLSLPGNIMWLYMPAFEKPKKISVLSHSQAFTGTDFSYEDMATTPYSERFTPMLQSSGTNDYVLELVPKSGKSKYSKIILKVDKAEGYPISMNFYNERGKMFKEATYTYEKIGKYWNASEVIMKDLEKNHSTKIALKDIKFDQGLSDDLFLVEKLKL
jgi:outer membrane lipoprotein-sorting protein